LDDGGLISGTAGEDLYIGDVVHLSKDGKYYRNVTKSIKHDQDKLRYDLIPGEFLEELAKVLTFGAKKYSDRNWEKGTFTYGRIFAALMRHLWAFWRGEELDEESNFSHLSHAACCLCFLITYRARNLGTDDRKEVKLIG